jgi:hypothetical protein
MAIRRVIISAILTLGVTGSILAGSALSATTQASAATAHSTVQANMFYHD